MSEDKWVTETRFELDRALDEIEEARRIGRTLFRDLNAYSKDQLEENLLYIEALLAVALEYAQKAREMAKGVKSE